MQVHAGYEWGGDKILSVRYIGFISLTNSLLTVGCTYSRNIYVIIGSNTNRFVYEHV